VEAVTNGAGDCYRPTEAPAVIGGASETDAITADPDNINIAAVDSLLYLGVLAGAPLADLRYRPAMHPGPAEAIRSNASTGREDSDRDRGTQRCTEGTQARRHAPWLPPENL
jgi:hypothetical protein